MLLDRRRFLVVAAGGGLAIAASALSACETAPPPAPLAPAPEPDVLRQTFLTIDQDGVVTVFAKHLDMGQGIWTGLSTLVAEELDAAWEQVRVVGAPTAPEYKNLTFGSQTTGGSTSIANSYQQMREAGAIARALIVQAAAESWGAPPDEIVIDDGRVRYPATGRETDFGKLAGRASQLQPPAAVTLKAPEAFRYLGKSFPRLDSRAKVEGRELYGIDVRLPGMKVAVMARSPRLGGKLKSVDGAAARATPGVIDVLATESGAAVIAENSWAAMQGRARLKTEWDDTHAETRSSAQMLADYRKAADDEGLVATERGDADGALAKAARIVEAEFDLPYLAHAPMEPLAAVCAITADGAELWGGIQSQTFNQKVLAEKLGLPVEKVVIHSLQAGGSFGRRATLNSDWIAELGDVMKAAGGAYPIKLLWTRDDDIKGGYYRPMSYHRVKAGLDSRGRIVGLNQQIVSQSLLFGIPYGDAVARDVDPTVVEGAMATLYEIDNARLVWTPANARVPVTLYRSVGHSHNAFVKEVMMERLARAARRDPVDMRLAHLSGNPRQQAVLRKVADMAGWGRRLPPDRYLGVAVHEAFKSHVAQIVEIEQGKSGFRILEAWCAVDCGLAINPDIVAAQMEGGIGYGLSGAMAARITFDGGRVVQSNFHDYPSLRINEYPAKVSVFVTPSAEPPTGVGEPGATPIAAAVANAIETATGKTITSLPMRG
jgi:isoquinoline 1-oxidoreductase beta subunit